MIISSDQPRLRYAIGDIHGCLPQLRSAMQWCWADALELGEKPEIIILGDLVDKGPNSRGVVEYLMKARHSTAYDLIILRGNHDEVFQRAYFDPRDPLAATWWEFGGQEALMSYGWDPLEEPIAFDLHKYIPRQHAEFLAALPLMYETTENYFVHAGLNPEFQISEQSEKDMMWIRSKFLKSAHDFGKLVVHGHAPMGKRPVMTSNRISLDTGCYMQGRLSVGRFLPRYSTPSFHIFGAAGVIEEIIEPNKLDLR